jgi:hypothetical protein
VTFVVVFVVAPARRSAAALCKVWWCRSCGGVCACVRARTRPGASIQTSAISSNVHRCDLLVSQERCLRLWAER